MCGGRFSGVTHPYTYNYKPYGHFHVKGLVFCLTEGEK